MASQVERVFYGSNQVPGQQLSREDIKQLRFRIKRDDGTIDNVVFDPLVGQDLYMACLKFFKNYSHGSTPTEVGHYEAGEAGANGNDFDVEINNQEIFLFREDDLVLTDSEFDRLNADLAGWTPVALRSTSSDDVQHQWLYLSRSPDTGIRFICIEDTKARIAVIAPDSPHNIAISDAFDTSLFELKSNKTSYIDPTINQAGKYLGGSAVNGFVEKRTFAISVPYGTTNSNTFTKILEFNETFDGSRTRGSIFARLKIQFVGTSIRHRLREIDAYIGYELNGQKAFVTFGNCYNTLIGNDLKKLHIVTYDTAARRRIEVYLEHRELTAMTNWISVEVCENFEILEQSWTLTQTSHSSWKIPLASYDWDEVNGASIQPTAAALPTTGVLKTDSYIVQSGNQAPFTYVPYDVVASTMPVAKLANNSGDTRLVFKLYSSEGWVAIGKVERASSVFKLNFSAIADKPNFNNGVATPYIYLSLLDGVYFVNLRIDSYHTVAKSIAIEVENENKDWEFFGSIPPVSVGTAVSGTDTYMKADLTAEVIDQGTNVPAPTSSTKVLTKQVDANGREFWETEEMSDIPIEKLNALRDNTAELTYQINRNADIGNLPDIPNITGSLLSTYISTFLGNEDTQILYNRNGNESLLLLSRGSAAAYWGALALSFKDNYLRIGRNSNDSADVFTKMWAGYSDKAGESDYVNTQNTSETDFDLIVPSQYKMCSYSINGAYANGPIGNTGYWGVLQVFWRNGVPYQLFFNDTKMWVRYTSTQSGGTWTNWNPWALVNSIGSSQGSPTNPIYLKSNGSAAPCNLRLVSATSDVSLGALGNGEDAWIRVRNAGNSSITVTAGTLNRTLSPSQSCDVYGYNGSYVQIS